MPRRDVEAVILLSDGINNSARNPLEAADKAGLRIHAIGVGASLRNNATYHDVQVSGIDCPDRMTINNIARVSASIESVGLPGAWCRSNLPKTARKSPSRSLRSNRPAACQQ